MVAKKKENPYGGFVMMALSLVGVIIVLMTVLAIFALVGAWLYFGQAIKKYQGVRGRKDFRLTPADQQTLRDFTQAKIRIESRLAEINKLRRNLPLKTDGSFDSRNKEGRSLNSELQTLRAELEQCDQTIDHLSDLEESDYRRWVTIKSGLYSSRVSMAAFPCIALIIFAMAPTAVVNLSTVIEKSTGLPQAEGINGIYGILSTTAGVASILFLLTWGIWRSIALKLNNA